MGEGRRGGECKEAARPREREGGEEERRGGEGTREVEDMQVEGCAKNKIR